MKKLLVSLLVILLLIGSILYLRRSDSCLLPFPSGQFKVISIKKIRGKTYTLSSTSSGWHDKMFFINLYDKPLKKNDCGLVSNSPLYSDTYDPAKKINIVVLGDKFTIKNVNERNQNQDIIVTW